MSKQFEVLKIEERTRLGGAGNVERYYRHTIRTAGGTNLTVDIDEADFTEEKVKPILEDKAAEADKILKI